MVMKYALREKDIIIEKTTRADSDKKCKAAQKERDEAVTKMKTAVADKTKFQHLSDSRVSVLIYYSFLVTIKTVFSCIETKSFFAIYII